MEPAQKMSESEMEVMEAVWAFDGPVTSAQVQERLSARGWKPTTVLTFLSRGSLRSFFAALSGEEKLTEADVEELKHWLDEQ